MYLLDASELIRFFWLSIWWFVSDDRGAYVGLLCKIIHNNVTEDYYKLNTKYALLYTLALAIPRPRNIICIVIIRSGPLICVCAALSRIRFVCVLRSVLFKISSRAAAIWCNASIDRMEARYKSWRIRVDVKSQCVVQSEYWFNNKFIT